MFKEKLRKIMELKEKLVELDEQEKRYKQQISIQRKGINSSIELIKHRAVKKMSQRFGSFAQASEKTQSCISTHLLEDFKDVCSLFSHGIPDSLAKDSRVLLKHFFEKEDVESISSFMKYRCGSYFRSKDYDKKRTKYMDKLEIDPTPYYSEYAKYILGYGEYREDILKFMMLCGKLDKQSALGDEDSVYYSPISQKQIISASIGEFGNLANHVYADGEFGVFDQDREILMYWHDEGYKKESCMEL